MVTKQASGWKKRINYVLAPNRAYAGKVEIHSRNFDKYKVEVWIRENEPSRVTIVVFCKYAENTFSVIEKVPGLLDLATAKKIATMKLYDYWAKELEQFFLW